jgi:hypothetical protein
MKRGPKKRRCEDCKRKKKRCPPDHLIEKPPGEESKDEEEGEAEREEDPYAQAGASTAATCRNAATKYSCVTMPNYHCTELSSGFVFCPSAKDCENACLPPSLSP